MDLPALAVSALPAAAELVAAALLWAAAAALSLSRAAPAGLDLLADRVRNGIVAVATGAGFWAALLCLITALTGADGQWLAPLPLGGALLLSAALASLPIRAAAGGPPWLPLLAAAACACGFAAVALLHVEALGVASPSALVAGAVLLAIAAGQAVLAQAQRWLRSGAQPVAASRLGLGAFASTAAAALPLLLLQGGLPVLVSPVGSTGAPWLIAGCAAALMAMAAAGATIDRRSASVQRRLHERLRATSAQASGNALSDALTGLPNRAGFAAWLAPAIGQALRDDQQLALLVIGIDGFKKVNDAFGSGGGDSALVALARRIESARSRLGNAALSAGPLARTGGDEFTLVLQGRPTRDDAARAATRLLALIAAPLAFDAGEVTLTASIGVACAPQDGDAQTLQAHAEAALRAAKEAGGAGHALFEARIVDEARDRLDLLRDLRAAIDGHQLELYYQPKIDARSGQYTAAEALLRWNHPTRGLLGPGLFVPLAEKYGLIGALGNWVIDDACRQARKWRKTGLKMRVAINLSAVQMRDEGLVERIQDALHKHGVDPSRLTCEITETVAMEDTQVTQHTFERLGAAGIHLSIDDFGTGYSSLAYLRRLPAAELKIDRAFVKDLGDSDDARAIVDAVVKMAHALGLRVVAEGVETLRQRDVLLELGCDELQGFLFAKPMRASVLLRGALDDRARQKDFRPSLFADTNTPTQLHTMVQV